MAEALTAAASSELERHSEQIDRENESDEYTVFAEDNESLESCACRQTPPPLITLRNPPTQGAD